MKKCLILAALAALAVSAFVQAADCVGVARDGRTVCATQPVPVSAPAAQPIIPAVPSGVGSDHWVFYTAIIPYAPLREVVVATIDGHNVTGFPVK